MTKIRPEKHAGSQLIDYVTFVAGSNESELKIPYESPETDFKIIAVSRGVVMSVVTLSPQRRTVDLMSVIEK